MELLDNVQHTNETLDDARAGKIPEGLTTGVPKLDDHLRFKKGQFVMVNGHDNVGKTDWILYYFLLLTLKHGLKWTICSTENKIYSLKRRLVQFAQGGFIADISNDLYQSGREYIDQHFKFLRNDVLMSYGDVLKCSEELESDGVLLDPWNSFKIDDSVNQHTFDYKACGEIRRFAAKTGQTVYINTHIASEFARKLYHKDHVYALNLMPPQKADTEGGQKFANRADDFLTIHRMTQHADRWNITEVYVRKVKDMDTGGRPTVMDAPIEFEMANKFRYLVNAIDPITGKSHKQNLFP